VADPPEYLVVSLEYLVVSLIVTSPLHGSAKRMISAADDSAALSDIAPHDGIPATPSSSTKDFPIDFDQV
jgi:hypothetical protein